MSKRKSRKRNPQIRPYRPKPLRKPPPFLENHTLRNIGLGLTIGEATAVCRNRSPMIKVRMCDEKAIQMLAKSWGTAITKEGYLACPPTPKNPKGKAHVTVAGGTRADLIMKGYEPEILDTEIHKKWLRVREYCPKKPPRKYPPKKRRRRP